MHDESVNQRMGELKPDAIREEVARQYTRAAREECCSGENGDSLQKGIASRCAGYSDEELAALPGDSVSNSFGCGNPLAHVNLREGDVVIDLGSGAGIDVLLAAQRVGSAGFVIGIDMTDEMVTRARRNIEEAETSNAEIRKGLIEILPVEDASADWVISNCVINLSPEKQKVFNEIARVLKPNGRISISDIVANDLPQWIRNSASAFGSCIGGAISESEYIQGLQNVGITDIHVVDRFEYDTGQLQELLLACCDAAPDTRSKSLPGMSELISTLSQQVASVRFTGVKKCC